MYAQCDSLIAKFPMPRELKRSLAVRRHCRKAGHRFYSLATMSNLYVRLKTGFFTNLKTFNLKAKIGNDAYWIPPRLWTYAAESQPDGDFSQHSNAVLAEVLGCVQYAANLKELLTDAGFLDGDGKIHNWAAHNSYHEAYSARAKKAAATRWGDRRRTQKQKQEKERGNPKEKKSTNGQAVLNGSSSTTDGTSNIRGGISLSVGDAAAFNGAWGLWLKHSSQLKYPPTESAIGAQWKKCNDNGAEWAETCINYSIECNSKTILEDPSVY